MGLDKVKNHRGRHPTDYVGSRPQLEDSYKWNIEEAPW